jgi:hypothetical protein
VRNAQVARLVIGRFRVQVPAPAVTNLQVNGSLASLGGARAAALLTALLTLRIRHRLRETFRHRGRSLANHLRIEPQRDRGIGVAEAGSNDMNRHARQQQSRRVQVSEVVQTRGWTFAPGSQTPLRPPNAVRDARRCLIGQLVETRAAATTREEYG